MPRYCKRCKLFEGGLPEEKKQISCPHRFWDETKVRANYTIDESIYLWLKDKSKRTGESASSIVTLALIDMKIKDYGETAEKVRWLAGNEL